jgi:tRNA pseudouridine55 synthase
VIVHELVVTDFAPSDYPELGLRIVCSTGTYVRTLADDIAAALGGRAHLSALRRVRNGSLHVASARSIEQLAALADSGSMESALLTPAAALADLPAIEVDADLVAAIANGRRLERDMVDIAPGFAGIVRVLDPTGELLAVSRVDSGRVVPEVVVPQ